MKKFIKIHLSFFSSSALKTSNAFNCQSHERLGMSSSLQIDADVQQKTPETSSELDLD